ncbi:Enamine deaminase RidA, house cleaning of reactive enamine intermediates, YjgF/YER057c/UK114 family [Rhizobiales bacterium GAS113]|nr:Enamine deaminase RidA, house cleaning of reactive enamine intermediates, YjgF/YER057c/UK114 family [Rhizobiales bacterium GAS113]
MSSLERFLAFDAAPFPSGGRYPSPVARAVRVDERVFLSGGSAQKADGSIAGLGDPAAQAEAALDNIEAALTAAGGRLADITKLTTCIVDPAHRKPVYEVIGRRLKDVFPVSTGLVVAGLPMVEQMVQIDADAVIGSPVRRIRSFEMKSWFGQDIAWQGSMVAAGERELFIRGQTGSALDGSHMAGLGRRPEDAAAQAELAMTNLGTLLSEAGSSLDDICKMTVYINDRAYRLAVYPVIGRHLRGIHPVSTGIITTGFARPEILFEIDIQAIRSRGARHERYRRYHSSKAKYGFAQQSLDCDLCMAVRAGGRVILRGQTGGDLSEVMRGQGDVVVQSEQAMDNVEVLLGEAGATLADVTKATLFVTDRAFMADATEVILRRLKGVMPAFSAIVIKGLASPELLMEVDITADLAGRVP